VMQYMIMPVAVIVLLIVAVSLASTVMASEKEAKTLEVLLTLPIDRKAVFLGKLFGTLVVSLAGAVGYVFGLSYYVNVAIGGATLGDINLEAIGFYLTPLDYLLVGISLLLSLVALTMLALVISSFAEDVRGASALVQVLILPLMIMSMISSFMFMIPVSKELETILVLIPFSNPAAVIYALFLKDYEIVALGIVMLLLEASGILMLGAKLYSGEKILTLRLGKKKKKIGE
ncbi:MAG: ABC transporter permease, partial [Candidatus Korarchaeota archaeon]